MTERLRVVFDTNVFVSAALSQNPTSPTRELFRHWLAGEFVLLFSQALADEVIEKLLEHQIDADQIAELIAHLERIAEWVEVSAKDVRPVIAADPDDDDVVLACAVAGQADYLVTYDPHFDVLGGVYQGVRIVKALPFLWAVRGGPHPVKGE